MTSGASIQEVINAIAAMRKEAFQPMPGPQQAAPADPAMAGQPPMDPAMQQGAPPPQGQPPMDPAMMQQGAPPPPMDPAMAGGMPPADPMAGGAPPQEDIMAQLGPVFEEFMGTVEELGQAVQQMGQQLQMVTKDSAENKHGMIELNAKFDMLQKTLNEPSPYEAQMDPAAMGGGGAMGEPAGVAPAPEQPQQGLI